MNKVFYYKIYGLKIKSEVEMKELLSIDKVSDNEIDVNIMCGIIPDEVKQRLNSNLWFNYEKESMVFTVNGTATYYIYGGDTIIVEKEDGAEHQAVKTFLLGTSFGMILSQRKSVAMHGGTILVNGKAVLLTGDSGAGKSTLTNAFRHNGYPFMADDVSLTEEQKDGKVIVHPAYPQQKICKDAMLKMGYNIEDYTLIDEGREKYVIPTHKTFVKESKPLGAMIHITVGDVDKVQIEEITGQDKMTTVIKNIYRTEILWRYGVAPEYFKKVFNISKKVPLYRITRPKGEFSVNEQIETIVKTIK